MTRCVRVHCRQVLDKEKRECEAKPRSIRLCGMQQQQRSRETSSSVGDGDEAALESTAAFFTSRLTGNNDRGSDENASSSVGRFPLVRSSSSDRQQDGPSVFTVARIAASLASLSPSHLHPLPWSQGGGGDDADSNDNALLAGGPRRPRRPRQRTDVRRMGSQDSQDPAKPNQVGVSSAATSEVQATTNNFQVIVGDEQWTKFMVHVHDGKDISVTQEWPTSHDVAVLVKKQWHRDEQRFLVTQYASDLSRPSWKTTGNGATDSPTPQEV